MTRDRDPHWACLKGCFEQYPERIARCTSRYRFAKGQLEELLRLLDGRCMVCLSCHAMIVDTATRTAERKQRGVLCLWCKDRVAGYEGSYGEGKPLAVMCRCKTGDVTEWEQRISAATAQYLNRTALLEIYPENAERMATLIADVSVRGPDPHHIWSGAPVAELPQLPAREVVPEHGFGEVPPLARPRCSNECREHSEHIYFACFDEPTKLRDSDVDGIAVRHYVGWTRQHPPIQRVGQHGAICRESLVGIVAGTSDEEESVKANDPCPQCGKPLEYRPRKMRPGRK